METNKQLVRAGYLLSAALFFIPLIDAAMPLLPLQLGEPRWRWGVIGQFSNVLLVPMLGLLLAIALATLSDGRRVKRVVGAFCGILALILTAMSVSFALDFFQVRTLVPSNMRHAMTVASSTALIKNILAIITLALLSRAGFTGPKISTAREHVRTVDTPASPLIGGGTRSTRSE